MAQKVRSGQETVYLDSENRDLIAELMKKYPTQSKSAFINAALRFYYPYAERGIDGNLQPYTLENGPKLEPDASALKAEIDRVRRVVIQVMDERDKKRKVRVA